MIVESLTTKEALLSAIESAAKALSETRDAMQDLRKSEGRQSFVLLILNTLLEEEIGTEAFEELAAKRSASRFNR